jgi:Pyruvate/2-oxoacid:ferredoxin oxidoreductase delta subunit
VSQYEKDLAAEMRAVELLRDLIEQNRDALQPIAHWGDGQGGYMLSVIQEVMGIAPVEPSTTYRKKVISQKLRTAVFERDLYRCVRCKTHLDLCADHIVPESKGGETSIDNLQTLCRSCNSSKGVR